MAKSAESFGTIYLIMNQMSLGNETFIQDTVIKTLIFLKDGLCQILNPQFKCLLHHVTKKNHDTCDFEI